MPPKKAAKKRALSNTSKNDAKKQKLESKTILQTYQSRNRHLPSIPLEITYFTSPNKSVGDNHGNCDPIIMAFKRCDPIQKIISLYTTICAASPLWAFFKDRRFVILLHLVESENADLFQTLLQIASAENVTSGEQDTFFKYLYFEKKLQPEFDAVKKMQDQEDVFQKACLNSKYKSKKLGLVPEDIHLLVFKYLPVNCAVKCIQVCKTWFKMICCPVGYDHIPVITRFFDLSAFQQGNKRKLFETLMLRFGKHLKEIPKSFYFDLAWYPCFPAIEKLKIDEVDNFLLVCEVIAKYCKHLRHVTCTSMPTESSAVPLFSNLAHAEHIEFTSDEGDISVDVISNEEIDALSAVTTGKLNALILNSCCEELTMESMAKLVTISPLLDTLVFLYEYNTLECVYDKELEEGKNPLVEALIALNKKFSYLAINYISKQDAKKLKPLCKKYYFMYSQDTDDCEGTEYYEYMKHKQEGKDKKEGKHDAQDNENEDDE